eukprot:1899046-Prymnesium_polylepis.1
MRTSSRGRGSLAADPDDTRSSNCTSSMYWRCAQGRPPWARCLGDVQRVSRAASSRARSSR